MEESFFKKTIKKYQDKFSETKFWAVLSKYARKIGLKTVYTGLLLFYAYQRKETPAWAKRIVLGTLAYLVAPIDLMPDLSPFFGFTDDIGILGFGLVTIAGYVNDEVKANAREKLKAYFGSFNEEDLKEVDQKL